MKDNLAIKKKVFDVNLHLSNSSLVIQNFGNASQRFKNSFIIKPSGINLKIHNHTDMVSMDMEGNLLEGDLKPSSDEPTHRVIYNSSNYVEGIVHTHSKYATAYAQAAIEIENYGTTHSDFSQNNILVTDPLTELEVDKDYELNTGHKIIEKLRLNKIDFSETPGILSIRHGVFAWGADIDEAYRNAEIIEYIAELAFLTNRLTNNPKTIEEYIASKHFQRKHGPNKYYGQ